MKEGKDLLAKKMDLSGAEAIHLLERFISEGFLSSESFKHFSGTNLFGRNVYRESGTDLSFLAGLAATGLRSSVFMKNEELADNHNPLGELVRQHLPVVVHYATSTSHGKGRQPSSSYQSLHAVGGSGCFQLVAANHQEVIDLGLIAHKIAERSLIPGICAMDGPAIAWQKGPVQIPSADKLRRFLGDPDAHMNPPTPAQEILFGKDRRRIPQWFSLDTPTMSGISKEAWALDLEGAAHYRYFNHHLPQIIEEVMKEYETLDGQQLTPIQDYRAEKADYLILTLGSTFQQVKPVVDHLRTKERLKIGCLNITLLRPFPQRQLEKALKGVKAVTVLESFSGREHGDGLLFREIKSAVQGLGKQAPRLFSALHGHKLSSEALTGAVHNMTQKKEQRDRLFLDLQFTKNEPSRPQYEILLQSIRRAYPDIAVESIVEHQSAALQKQQHAPKLPFSVQRYRDEGPSYTRLSRFYHHTACFYQSGVTVELVADPYQALSILPAATASFANIGEHRSSLPLFQAQNCTGCGACFTHCPHSAIPPIVIGLESLIRSAMDIAARQGTPVTGLTPMVRNLAKVAASVIKEQENEISQINDFLPKAFDQLAQQMALSGDRLDKAKEEVDILISCIGDFPLAATESFFHQREVMENGTGELFSLAVDPLSCTGCGLCVSLCEEEALVMQPSEKELEEKCQVDLLLWEQLPDTSADTIRRMIHQEDYDPFAATLLSRNFYLSTTGGSTSEAGTPAKSMMHLVTAVAESVMQARLAGQINRLQKLVEDLGANIHRHLSDALPHDDFHLSVEEMQESKLPLDAVIRNLQTEEQSHLVDTPTLQRKIELLNDLKELHWALKEGPTGGGRARYGLSISKSEGLPWADDYPYNPFTAPVVWHWDGAAPERLRGMMFGLRRHLIDNIRLLRRAALEIKDKYRPAIHDEEIGRLGWDEMEEEEKQLLAPIFLVGDSHLFSQTNSSGLLDLLMLDMPVKVVVFDKAVEHAASSLTRSNTALFAAMSLRYAQIIRGSYGAGRSLFDGLRDGIYSMKPALFHLLTPESVDNNDQNKLWTDLPDLALKTRAFPFFRYDPDVASGYLASDIQIDANPFVNQSWVSTQLSYLEGEQEKEKTYSLTYADWLFCQKDWQPFFQPLESDGIPIPVADYLTLEPKERAGKAPVIYTVNEDRQLTAYFAMPPVIKATQNALRQWDSLREIAGALSPFPEKLREQIETKLTEKHEQTMAELKAAYEEKLRLQEGVMMEQVRIKLRNKLLALSRQGKPTEIE